MTEEVLDEGEGNENTEVQPTPQPEPPKVDVVPHAALHEQRMVNKQLQEELRQSRQAQERMETTFQKMLSQLNEKPAPKYEEDPLGHMAARNETLEKEVKNLSTKIEGYSKESQQAAFMTQINSHLSASEAEFRATHPDYDAAVKHLKDVTRADLSDQGMSGAEVEHTLNAGKIGLAHAAIQQGKNPAEVLYERAKRYGYKGQVQEDKIQTLAKGQALSKTVTGGGGAAAVTLRELSEIPDDQIEAMIADPKKWDALIRGNVVH